MTGDAGVALPRAVRVALDRVRDGVWLLDASGRTTYVNAPMADLLGAPAEDVLGSALFDWVDLVEPGAGATQPVDRSCRLTRLDGGTVWVRLTATPVQDDEGLPAGAAVVVEHVGVDVGATAEAPVAPPVVGQVPTPLPMPAPRRAPDDDEQAMQRISELIAAGASLNTIAAALNADGLVGPRGRRWHASSVARALYRVR